MWCVARFVQFKKFKFFRGCFSRFLNCTNGTESQNASHIVILWMRLSKFVWKELLMGLIIKNFLELNNLAMTLRKHVNNSAIVENMWKQKINFLFKLFWLPLQYHNYTWRNHFILIISSLKKLIWANFILKASYLLLAF